MDYIKIATLQNISANNAVRVVVSSMNTYINSTNQLQLVISTPYSSVELIYSASNGVWRILTPFVPIQKTVNGITEQETKQLNKKNFLIFG